MRNINRREFLVASAPAVAAARLGAADTGKSRVGLVASAHNRLPRPASAEDPLDYPRVRDLVWKAIEYGRPRAGSLEAKIRPGSWVVIKPNTVSLLTRHAYRTGDVTDLRVIRAVVEYVARKSRAARITVAEGGSYRGFHDPATDTVLRQNGVHIDALTCNWEKEFPGMEGATLGGVIREFSAQFPGKKFDYVDLSYDAVRDASGEFKRLEVPRTPRGVGAFGLRPDYFVTNTIRNCDSLISVPVAKVHADCGITACLKNYVGTAPRQIYADPKGFSNTRLHREHTVEGRIDGFIVDLASFHPPDYNVVDGIRGLQYAEHNNGRAGQTVQRNLILAGEDTVAADTLVAYLLGYSTWDMEFLHMAAQRDLGTMDMNKIEAVGDEPDRFRKTWGKTRGWHGRCNREWRVSGDPAANLAAWARYTAPTDTLNFSKPAGKVVPGTTYSAAVRVEADGHRRAFLWVGTQGRVTALLNGETVMQEENLTRYRVGQFQQPVELRSGENQLVFRVEAASDQAGLSALLVGPRNDGDTVEGIRWLG